MVGVFLEFRSCGSLPFPLHPRLVQGSGSISPSAGTSPKVNWAVCVCGGVAVNFLTEDQLQVLNYGFGFVSTPIYNYFQIRINCLKFIRQLKLHVFFGDTKDNICQFRSKSTFTHNIQDLVVHLRK